jgi:hypothetical protein
MLSRFAIQSFFTAWVNEFVPDYRNRAQAKGADTGTNIVTLQRLLNSLQQDISNKKSKKVIN